jgi:WXG100 family type VII secretion target
MKMADRITIETDEMRAAVSTYEAQKNIKMDAIASMKSAVETMDSSWDGPASDVFMGAFNLLYGKMMKTEERMDDAINELNRIVEKTEADSADVANVGRGAEAMANSL